MAAPAPDKMPVSRSGFNAENFSSICIPVGLHFGRDIFEPLCAAGNWKLIEYRLDMLREGKIEDILREKPALLIIPTFYKINADIAKILKENTAALASVSTGIDHVDMPSLKNSGIEYFYAPGMNAKSVAEYVISAFPLLVPEERLLKPGEMIVGLIGYGRIGRTIGEYLAKLSIKYIYNDPFLGDDFDSRPLKEVLACDIVSFHVPLTDTGPHPTRDMIDDEYISQIRPGASIINTARGSIFTSRSFRQLCANFRSIMDVFPSEPPGVEMIELPTYATPHVAGYNASARAGGGVHVARQFAEWAGLRYESIPIPEIIESKINVIDFLNAESSMLKKNPGSFSSRRDSYPLRGGWKEARRTMERFSSFHKKILTNLV